MGGSLPSSPSEASTSGADPRRAVLDATAGAVAGCVQRLVVAPLDVIKIRFQVQIEPVGKAVSGAAKAAAGPLKSHYTSLWQAAHTIVREEGVQALWRGTLPGQLLAVPYTAVQFLTLQQCKLQAKKMGLTEKPGVAPAVSFVSGAIAGVAGTIASYPFDLLRTMLAAQGEPKVYATMGDAARGIVLQRGYTGLYSGLRVTLLEIIPYAALQFGLYDALNNAYDGMRHTAAQRAARRRSNAGASSSSSSSSSASSSGSGGRSLQRGGQRGGGSQGQAFGAMDVDDVVVDAGPRGSWQQFVCGLAAGTMAKLATHPLDVVKKRYQVAGLDRSLRYGARVAPRSVSSIRTCFHEIAVREGAAGFYKGVVPSLLKAAPAAAVTLTTYEFLVWYLVGRSCGAAKGPSPSSKSSKSSAPASATLAAAAAAAAAAATVASTAKERGGGRQ